MNQFVIKRLKDLGYENCESTYYDYIKTWISFWRGKNDNFYKYLDSFGIQREMYSLGMAKKICEDWAGILWNEDMQITSDDKKTNNFIPKMLKEINFYDLFSDYIEKSFYSGTCGITIKIKDAVKTNKGIEKGLNTKIVLEGLTADKIIPLTITDRKITEVAFVSEVIFKGKKYYYLEIHTLKKDRKGKHYEIYNIYLDEQGNDFEMEGVEKTLILSTDIPLFYCLMPNYDNPVENNNGLGYSIIGKCLDQIKGVDIAYHNFVMDYYLGGKKVFYNKNLIKFETRTIKKSDGSTEIVEEPIYPDDIAKQQFMVVGDPMSNINDKTELKEHNPDLRFEANKGGTQMALNLLSFKADLGTDYYQFDSASGVVTATQYLGDRQDLVTNAKKHMRKVEDCCLSLIKSLLFVYRNIMKETVNENANLNLIKEDAFLTSTEDQKSEFRQDIASGLRQKWEYRVKFFGEDEKTAKEMTKSETESFLM